VAVDVLANDSDPDGDTLSISSASPSAAHGTVSCSASQCTYTPDSGYVGPDSFDYTISDGHGHSAAATARVTVSAGPAVSPPAAPEADLSISVSGPGSAKSGSKAAFTISVMNLGPDTAKDVVVTDTLPGELTLVPGSVLASGVAGVSCSVSGSTIRCTVPSLAVGSTLNIAFAARIVSAAAVIVDQATVVSSTSDPVSSDNASSAAVTVSLAQPAAAVKTTLSIKQVAKLKRGSKGKLQPGQAFVYRITVRNTGRYTAKHVKVCELQSPRLVYVSAHKAKSTKGRVCWTIAKFAPGKSRTFVVKVRVDNTVRRGLIRSTAIASAANAKRLVRSKAKTPVEGRPLQSGRAQGVTG